MRVLIDTNVILDVLCDRPPFAEMSSKVFALCEIGKVEGYIFALSLPNIVYIMRKELDAQKIRDILEKLSLIFTVADLKAEDIKKAASMDFDDFEDALQSVCAARINADYIVARNVRDFAKSATAATEPAKFIEMLA